MTTTTELADIATGFRAFADAVREFSVSARRCAEVFGSYISASDSLWAIVPGEWPDDFTLLNRYLRTGVKPSFLINE